VARDEFRFIDKYLDKDPNRGSYYPEMYERVKDYVYVKGEYALSDDIRIIPTPGHTLGHQSIVANVSGQNLIYSGDVSPLKVNLERKIAMTGYDRTELLHSMKKLLKFKNSKWIFSHDNSQVTLRSIIRL
jgi:N-acyl homoserine lactone hydrolase